MYKSVADFEKSFPGVKGMAAKQKTKCLDIFNALKKEGMDDGKAIAVAISRCKQMKMGERFEFTSTVELSEGSKKSEIEMLRVGTIRDRGLDITPTMLEDFVRNFQDDVYGTELQVNLGHYREGEAAGWIKTLRVSGEQLLGMVEWTELGIEKLTKKLYKFVSAEFAFDYPDADTGAMTPNVFIGAALTNTPALKKQKPITLSEQEIDLLTNKTIMLKKLIEDLKGRSKLSESDTKFARTLLSEASAEDQEAMKADVEDLEKKQAEQAAADAKAAEEAKQAEEAKLAEATKGTVSLAEHLALKEKYEKVELSEVVETNLMLSEKRPAGFRPDAKEEAVKFMLSLNETQRAAFLSLMSKNSHVEFGEKGKAVNADELKKTQLSEEQKQEAIVKRSHELLAEKKAANITEAQKMAMKELSN